MDYKEKYEEVVKQILENAGIPPYKDGNSWCILKGENLQAGYCGFGDTIEDALIAFLKDIPSQKDTIPAESKHPRLRNKESWISKAKREKSFLEYLRGVFETNNGVENDPDLLIALHGQTLFELAQKESADGEGEVDLEKEIETYFKGWYMDETDQGYILHTPDDHAGLMSVKQIARHFYELGLKARKEE